MPLIVDRQTQKVVHTASKRAACTSLHNILSRPQYVSKLAILSPLPGVQPLTFGEICGHIDGAGNVSQLGVATNDDVVVYLAPSGAISAVAFLSICSQCTAAPLDPTLKVDDIVGAIEQLRPKCAVVFDGVDSIETREACSRCGIPLFLAVAKPETSGLFSFVDAASGVASSKDSFCVQKTAHIHGSKDLHRLRNPSHGIGLLLRTSGTTSKLGKVVPLVLGSIIGNSQVIAENLHLCSSDVALNAMPLFHIGGISSNLLSSLVTGGAVICMSEFEPAAFCELLSFGCQVQSRGDSREQRTVTPTWHSAAPSVHVALTEYVESALDGKVEHSLRFIRSGAARLTHDQLMKIEQVFKVPVVNSYSMTEQMPVTQLPCSVQPGVARRGLIVDSRPGSVGQPIPNSSLAVVDQALQPLPFGMPGEVCISGSMVFSQYPVDPAANAASFFCLDGQRFFRSGDTGYVDEEGFLYITGRCNELIKRGGELISPYEVEDLLTLHPDVAMALAFPVDSALYGQTVGAAVVLKQPQQRQNKPTISEQAFQLELGAFLTEQHGVRSSRVPEFIRLLCMDELPRTSTGKYRRNGLARQLGVKEPEGASGHIHADAPDETQSVRRKPSAASRAFTAACSFIARQSLPAAGSRPGQGRSVHSSQGIERWLPFRLASAAWRSGRSDSATATAEKPTEKPTEAKTPPCDIKVQTAKRKVTELLRMASYNDVCGHMCYLRSRSCITHYARGNPQWSFTLWLLRSAMAAPFERSLMVGDSASLEAQWESAAESAPISGESHSMLAVVMVGPPGSGKSTISRALANGCVVACVDDYKALRAPAIASFAQFVDFLYAKACLAEAAGADLLCDTTACTEAKRLAISLALRYAAPQATVLAINVEARPDQLDLLLSRVRERDASASQQPAIEAINHKPEPQRREMLAQWLEEHEAPELAAEPLLDKIVSLRCEQTASAVLAQARLGLPRPLRPLRYDLGAGLVRSCRSAHVGASSGLNLASGLTIACVKPLAVADGHTDAILEEAREAGFKVVRQKRLDCDREWAEKHAAAELAHKGWCAEFTEWLASGSVVAVALEAADGAAIQRWRDLLGPFEAPAPNTIRAKFGRPDALPHQNAAHGADSREQVVREACCLGWSDLVLHAPEAPRRGKVTLVAFLADATSPLVAAALHAQAELCRLAGLPSAALNIAPADGGCGAEGEGEAVGSMEVRRGPALAPTLHQHLAAAIAAGAALVCLSGLQRADGSDLELLRELAARQAPVVDQVVLWASCAQPLADSEVARAAPTHSFWMSPIHGITAEGRRDRERCRLWQVTLPVVLRGL